MASIDRMVDSTLRVFRKEAYHYSSLPVNQSIHHWNTLFGIHCVGGFRKELRDALLIDSQKVTRFSSTQELLRLSAQTALTAVQQYAQGLEPDVDVDKRQALEFLSYVMPLLQDQEQAQFLKSLEKLLDSQREGQERSSIRLCCVRVAGYLHMQGVKNRHFRIFSTATDYCKSLMMASNGFLSDLLLAPQVSSLLASYFQEELELLE